MSQQLSKIGSTPQLEGGVLATGPSSVLFCTAWSIPRHKVGTQSICAGQINYYIRAGIDLKSVPSIVLSLEQLTALNGMLVDFFLDQHVEHCDTKLS